MKTVSFEGKTYTVDDHNFLIDADTWDENFAKGMAKELGMSEGLTEEHLEVIHFIRSSFRKTGACPVIYETCRSLGLTSKTLQRLFPTGYLRGACLISGITYKYGWVYYREEPYPVEGEAPHHRTPGYVLKDKIYRVDLLGYLVDPTEWDEDFASRRAYELNIKGGLSEEHWHIIDFLRNYYMKYKKIPTIYECCEENQIEIEDLEKLFPTGYHRGAVKIAGLPTLK